MTSAPLVHLKGKLGLYGKAKIAVDTFAAVSKSHGAYMVRAPITTSDARKIVHLDEMKKRVPHEKEAATRGKANIPEYEEGDQKLVPRAPGTKIDPIITERAGKMTYAGKAYAIANASKSAAAAQRLHAKPRAFNDLVDPYEPLMPTPFEGEDVASFTKRMKAYERRMNKRIDDRQTKPVSHRKLRKAITGMSEGEIIVAARVSIQNELDDSMVTQEPEDVPPDLDRLLMADDFAFEINGELIYFSARMEQALYSLLRLPPASTEADYAALDASLQNMQDFDLDQLDGISGRRPPHLMFVFVNDRYVIMNKVHVASIIDEFREGQAVLGEGILVAPFPSSESEDS